MHICRECSLNKQPVHQPSHVLTAMAWYFFGTAARCTPVAQSVSSAVHVQDASSRQGAAAMGAAPPPQDSRGSTAQAPDAVSAPQQAAMSMVRVPFCYPLARLMLPLLVLLKASSPLSIGICILTNQSCPHPLICSHWQVHVRCSPGGCSTRDSDISNARDSDRLSWQNKATPG